MRLRPLIGIVTGLLLATTLVAPTWAGNGTILKKGSSTIVIYQSASARNKHWVEQGSRRSKHAGSARAAIYEYEKKGYKKVGTKQANF